LPDGEILLRSPTQMTGYYGLDESPIDKEGWLHTGDLGRLDDNGNLWITGRSKDMIIRGGENIAPAAIEGELMKVPGVSEAVVFGIVCWVVSVTCTLLAAYLLDGRAPLVAVLLMLAVQVAAVQYSAGLKLSYRPLGLETTIFFVIGSIALMPYWFVAGGLNREILITSALFGLWFLMVVNYGNASDREGDRSVSRHTLAVMLPPERFRIVLVTLLAAEVTLLTLLFTVTRTNPVLALAAVPVVALHSVQLYHGIRGKDWRKARLLGLFSLDAGCLGLALAFLLS